MAEEKFNIKKIYFILGLLIGIAVLSTTGFFTLLLKDKQNNVDNEVAEGQPQNVAQEKSIFERLAGTTGLDESRFSDCLTNNKYTSVVSDNYSQGVSLGVGGTPASFINGRLVPGALPVEDMKKEIDSVLNNTRKLAQDEKLADIAVDSSRDHVWGSDSATVTIVLFDDFQCPYCARHHQTIKQLMQDYGEQLRVVFKHFPLSQIHPQAQKAAEASECAAEQGKFWEYADQLFQNQASFGE